MLLRYLHGDKDLLRLAILFVRDRRQREDVTAQRWPVDLATSLGGFGMDAGGTAAAATALPTGPQGPAPHVVPAPSFYGTIDPGARRLQLLSRAHFDGLDWQNPVFLHLPRRAKQALYHLASKAEAGVGAKQGAGGPLAASISLYVYTVRRWADAVSQLPPANDTYARARARSKLRHHESAFAWCRDWPLRPQLLQPMPPAVMKVLEQAVGMLVDALQQIPSSAGGGGAAAASLGGVSSLAMPEEMKTNVCAG